MTPCRKMKKMLVLSVLVCMAFTMNGCLWAIGRMVAGLGGLLVRGVGAVVRGAGALLGGAVRGIGALGGAAVNGFGNGYNGSFGNNYNGGFAGGGGG